MQSQQAKTVCLVVLLSLIFIADCQALQTFQIRTSSKSLVAHCPRMTRSNDDISFYNPAISLTPSSTQVGMSAALSKASDEGWEVTICIADVGGTPLHVQRTAQAFPASYEIACGKARSAALFAKNTGDLENAVNVSGGRTALLSSPYLLMRGGVPILWNGRLCGSVGVSGVHSDQDESVAQAAVDAISKLLAGIPEPRSRL